MVERIDEYNKRPSTPCDGVVYRGDDGIQWKYIEEVNDWGIDLTDTETNTRYYSVDHLPKGEPSDKGGITGADAVFRWLDENK